MFSRTGPRGPTATGIRGRITDESGAPVAWVFAIAYTSADMRRVPDFTSAMTAADGRFVIYLPAGGATGSAPASTSARSRRRASPSASTRARRTTRSRSRPGPSWTASTSCSACSAADPGRARGSDLPGSQVPRCRAPAGPRNPARASAGEVDAPCAEPRSLHQLPGPASGLRASRRGTRALSPLRRALAGVRLAPPAPHPEAPAARPAERAVIFAIWVR